MEKVIEKWTTEVFEIKIGATVQDGGTRSKTITVGGQKALPFLGYEGRIPNKPALAAEVIDVLPENWLYFGEKYGDLISDPLTWIKKVEEKSPDLICLKLLSCHPDIKDNSRDYATQLVKEVLKITKLPLIILGCGHPEKDVEILPAISEAARNERILLGMATKDNYRTLAVAVIADGHNIIAESPLDINLMKQLNLLINDLGVELNRIIVHPLSPTIGYGFEYAYSIIERTRILGLSGDKLMASPIISIISDETLKIRETNLPEEELPNWGEIEKRVLAWELSTAVGYIAAGSDIIVTAHPDSIEILRKYIDSIPVF